MNLILEKLQRHLGSNDLDFRIQVDEVSDQAGMIRFGVAHDQNIDAAGIDLVLQQGDPGVTELGMAGVDQRGLFPAHQKGVVVVPLRRPNSMSKRLRSQSRERMVVVSAAIDSLCSESLGAAGATTMTRP